MNKRAGKIGMGVHVDRALAGGRMKTLAGFPGIEHKVVTVLSEMVQTINDEANIELVLRGRGRGQVCLDYGPTQEGSGALTPAAMISWLRGFRMCLNLVRDGQVTEAGCEEARDSTR